MGVVPRLLNWQKALCKIVRKQLFCVRHGAAASIRAALAQKADVELLGQKAPPAKKAKVAEAPKVDTSAAQGSATIFIKNLAWSATEEDLTEFFKECGAVENVRIGALLGLRYPLL